MSISKNMDNFNLDDYRTKLVKDKNIEEFINTYSYLNDTLKDNNTDKFWNTKIENAEVFEKIDSMTKDRILQAVKMIKDSEGKVLDLGFGYGYFEQKLKENNNNFELYGLDVSSIAVRNAIRKYGENFFIGTLGKLKFKSNFFDYVVSLECLEHVSSDKIFIVLQEIKRVLKKRGKVILSVPVNEKYTQNNNPNNHLRRYSKELFIQELILSGFRIEKVIQLFAFKKFYLIKNILSKIFPSRWQPNVILINAVKI